MLKGEDCLAGLGFQCRYVNVRFQEVPKLKVEVCGWMSFAQFALRGGGFRCMAFRLRGVGLRRGVVPGQKDPLVRQSPILLHTSPHMSVSIRT